LLGLVVGWRDAHAPAGAKAAVRCKTGLTLSSPRLTLSSVRSRRLPGCQLRCVRVGCGRTRSISRLASTALALTAGSPPADAVTGRHGRGPLTLAGMPAGGEAGARRLQRHRRGEGRHRQEQRERRGGGEGRGTHGGRRGGQVGGGACGERCEGGGFWLAEGQGASSREAVQGARAAATAAC
jgi:hypothetical protein